MGWCFVVGEKTDTDAPESIAINVSNVSSKDQHWLMLKEQSVLFIIVGVFNTIISYLLYAFLYHAA